MTENTKPNVFIIESLARADEKMNKFEGEILSRILSMKQKKSEYRYIRTKRELKEMLDEFIVSDMRYLHLSCHGSNDAVSLTYDNLPMQDFVQLVSPYLSKRRLFLSACSITTAKLTKSIVQNSKCHSVVGPKGNIYFDDAAIMWASFYHLMFNKNTNLMKNRNVIDSMQTIASTFNLSVRGSFLTKDERIVSGVIKPKQGSTSKLLLTA